MAADAAHGPQPTRRAQERLDAATSRAMALLALVLAVGVAVELVGFP